MSGQVVMDAENENLADTDTELQVLEQKKQDNETFLKQFNDAMNEDVAIPELQDNVNLSENQKAVQYLLKSGILEYIDDDNECIVQKCQSNVVGIQLNYGYGYQQNDDKSKNDGFLNKVKTLENYFRRINLETQQPDAIQIDWTMVKSAGKLNDSELKKIKELGFIEFTLRSEVYNGQFKKKRVSYFRVYTKGKKLWQFNPNAKLNPTRIGFLDTEKVITAILARCHELNIQIAEYVSDQGIKGDSIVSTLQLMLMTNNIVPKKVYKVE